jgi:hypothetical protein
MQQCLFTRTLEHGSRPSEVSTDQASAYPRAIEELMAAACHITEQYANNSVEADHGRLKARLRPMRGLKRLRSAQVISAGHAFVQNLRLGHYELSCDIDPQHQLTAISPNSLAPSDRRNAAENLVCFPPTQQARSECSWLRWVSSVPDSGVLTVAARCPRHRRRGPTTPRCWSRRGACPPAPAQLTRPPL